MWSHNLLGTTLPLFGVDLVDYGCFHSQVSDLVVEGNFNPPPIGLGLLSLITLLDLFRSIHIVRSDLQTLPPPSIIDFWLHFGIFGAFLGCFGVVWMSLKIRDQLNFPSLLGFGLMDCGL